MTEREDAGERLLRSFLIWTVILMGLATGGVILAYVLLW